MSRIFAIIVALALAASCVPSREMKSELSHLESRLDAAPDSVLTVLDKMDRSVFLPRSTRAAYALLYSEALDKNGILVRSDSIIAPAVRYYNYHGSPDDKLKVFYYRGLIAENDGLPEDAMEWFKKAETNLSPASPCSLAGRLYSHKSTLYYNAYDYVDALENNRLAAEWFEKGEDYLCLCYILLNITNLYICVNKPEFASITLNRITDYWQSSDFGCKVSYYVNCINLAIRNSSEDQVRTIISKCIHDIPNYKTDPDLCLKMAEAFLFCDDINSCASLLSEYDRVFNTKGINYYVLLSNYYEQTKQYQSSLTQLQKYIQIGGEQVSNIICSDLKYVEERYTSELKVYKNQQRATILAAIIFVLLTVSAIVFKTLKIRLSISERKYKEVEEEWKALKTIQQENTILGPNEMAPINKRLELLDKVILGHLSENPSLTKSANAEISLLLKNKELFIIETAKVFSACHPHFTEYLQKSGLSEWETGYCCLFIMGMYNKDSQPYFSKYVSENTNNSIRMKLGLTHNGQKLKTFLKEQYTILEGSSKSIN